MSTQVFVASTAFGLATLSAAMSDGAFPAADRRVLVLSNNAGIPESAPGVADVAGTAPLLEAFDDVYSYNALVAPGHPATWSPRPEDLPVWERALRSLWSLEGDLHLVLESIQVPPALALCQILGDAAIDVYADGLMSYGPTRNALPQTVGVRVRRLLHPDLVPGVRPLLLREFGVEPLLISTESLTKVIGVVGAETGPVAPAGPGPTAVLLGQYLSALRLLSEAEECGLHLEMVDGAVAAGYRNLVFKTHPGAPAGLAGPLTARAAELGARLTIRESPELVETWYASGAVDLVVGCFSTALATAGLYGVPAARVGTDLVLQRLKPYENSNRIPATVVAATVSPLADRAADAAMTPSLPGVAVGPLVETVGYLMQPSRNPDLRPAAVRLLEDRLEDLLPFVSRDRLTRLDLPGRVVPEVPDVVPDVPVVPDVAEVPVVRVTPAPPRPARALAKRLLGPRLSRHLSRMLRSRAGRTPR